MGNKYRRPVAVAAVMFVVGLLLAPAAALAADPPADVVLDAVVVVRHVDALDGPIAGATITVTSYRVQDAPIQVASATTDDEGAATLAGIARPAEGAGPVLLDVRSDLVSTTVDEAGCTEIASRSASESAIPVAASVEILLDSTAKSVEISCPEPTDPPADAEPSPDPEPPAEPSAGGVLAATGRPQITPPSTDTGEAAAASASRSPAVPGMLAVLGLFAGAVLAAIRRRGISRRGS
ncbi:MAG TPA: hypothetical protein VFO78_06885 [Candidatus Limnocylindrales bacterium]|nr:hypothetical protein [Candidatus Limnocylindrales bacterium]